MALEELESARVVLRDIEPRKIAVSDDMQKLQFLGLASLPIVEKRQDLLQHLMEPYCGARYPSFRCSGSKALTIDRFAVGVIITEIIVGTDLVIPMNYEKRVEDMFAVLEDYLDDGTTLLLNHLLLSEKRITIKEYIYNDLVDNPD